MASSGPNATGTSVNDTGVGTLAWNNPGNTTSSNNVYSASAGSGLGAATTNYLKTTNFGFSIPSGATIDGIVVEYERKANFNTGVNYMKDSTISLVKAGTIVGNNNADLVTQWSTTEGFFSYGSSSDLWGTTWTDTDINDSTFGAVLSCSRLRTGKSSPAASVDFVRITIYYTSGGGSTSASALLLAGD